MPRATQSLSVRAADGKALHGHVIPGGDGGGQRALVLGFGGNGWDAQSTALYLHAAFPNHDVAAFHYRGYPPSEGRPSAAALQADAAVILDSLTGGRDGPVVAVGVSLGAGVAAHLAALRDLDGVILLTAYDSLTEVARDVFPWAPVRLLFRHPMDPATDLARSTVPVALISASHDHVIPAARTQALRAALGPGRLVLDRTVPGDHDSIHLRTETRAALRSALAAMVD
jgi:pimeloyl-ACP methyl ester carboxylesterase